jgi:phosphatidylglycerophosphatase A
MIEPHKIVATWFYSGYLKPASGTWGTFAALPFCLLVVTVFGLVGVIIGSVILFINGMWAAAEMEKETGDHDASYIVIDEVVGMLIASIPLLYHMTWPMIFTCFVLFRLFDAVKIGPVGWCDRHVHGAFGVMIDDVVAGLMTVIVILGYLVWL